MNKTQAAPPNCAETTVYYHNYPELCSHGVAFHWWDAAYTSLHAVSYTHLTLPTICSV